MLFNVPRFGTNGGTSLLVMSERAMRLSRYRLPSPLVVVRREVTRARARSRRSLAVARVRVAARQAQCIVDRQPFRT